MSCHLPVCSQFYSFPCRLSSVLQRAGLCQLATFSRILPTDYQLDASSGTHWHVFGRCEEERSRCSCSLCFQPHVQPWRQQVALDSSGAGCSGSSTSGLEWLWPRGLCSSSSSIRRSRSRRTLGQFQGARFSAVGHHLGSFVLPVIAA